MVLAKALLRKIDPVQGIGSLEVDRGLRRAWLVVRDQIDWFLSQVRYTVKGGVVPCPPGQPPHMPAPPVPPALVEDSAPMVNPDAGAGSDALLVDESPTADKLPPEAGPPPADGTPPLLAPPACLAPPAPLAA